MSRSPRVATHTRLAARPNEPFPPGCDPQTARSPPERAVPPGLRPPVGSQPARTDAAGEIDFDNDGSLSCDDCDDNDVANYPGGTEICDGQDNDCNGLADFPGGEANCGGGAGYTGVYTLNQPITYSCLSGLYGWNFSTVSVVDSNPAIVVTAPTTPPGSMTGTFSSSTAFSASWTIGTLCVETYTFTGNFTSASTFSATFTSSFVGTCLDCVTNSWTVTGTL